MDDMEIVSPKTGKKKYQLNADGEVIELPLEEEEENDESNNRTVLE